MTKRDDLTRWNRAGLSRFRYVDGNAAEYLEILRQQLAKRFVDPDAQEERRWLQPAEIIPAGELPEENETLPMRQQRLSRRQKRIVAMYHQKRRDWAWEISRSFARSCHILTEHVNAYANEYYLGTATQWEHVRRLVSMLGYHPAPPASALTTLVFIAKDKDPGVLPKGFQVKYTPPKGGPKVIFETLEDLFLDPAVNEMRPKGWNRSEKPAVPSPKDQAESSGKEGPVSKIALKPVKHLQGVGTKWAQALTAKGYAQIKDFLHLDPEEASEIGIYETRLREFKAKALAISTFALESGWSDIVNWKLPDIASALPATLADKTGNREENVKDLQLRIELIGSYLDHGVYKEAQLTDLLTPAGDEDKAASDESGTLPSPWVAGKKPQVVASQVAMVIHGTKEWAEAATVASVDKTSRGINLQPSPLQKSWPTWSRADAILQVAPRWKKKCWLNGTNVIRTEAPHGLSAGAYICWKASEKWRFAKVIEADKRNLRLELKGDVPEKGDELSEARPLEGPNLPPDTEEIGLLDEELPADAVEDIKAANLIIPDRPPLPPFPAIVSISTEDNIVFSLGKLPEVGSFILPTPLLPIDIVKAAVKLLLEIGAMVIPSTGEPVFKYVEPMDLAVSLFDLVEQSDSVKWENTDRESVLQEIIAAIKLPEGEEPVFFKMVKQVFADKGPFLVVPKDPPVKAIAMESDPLFMFDGTPDKVIPGDRVVARFTAGLKAVTVSRVEASSTSEHFSLHLENVIGNEGELQKVYGDFRGILPAVGAELNETEVTAKKIELEEVPESLKVGRTLLMACSGKASVAAKIVRIEGNVITTDAKDFTCNKGNLLIHGNVALAGHGESRPVKILGSGNAAKTNQEFILEVDNISFTPDASMGGGVAAAIEVFVDGRIWKQVTALQDSGPGDHHYVIRMTEEGYVKILFGDGRHGRRLPTGNNNIRVRYRVGSGGSGNVVAHGLEKAVKPHPLVADILHLQQAAGGGDMEDVASLRENAPATVLALERAVSLSDYAHLARSQSSIWQARAHHQVLAGGRKEGVKVVIVPAEGAFSPEIKKSTTVFLQKHALPGVQVTVVNFVPVPFDLHVTLRINFEAFSADDVEKAVTAALLEYFALAKRKLGGHLYLSEVYGVVEKIKGIENSLAVLNDDSSLQIIRAGCESTVIFLAPEKGSTLSLTSEEYEP
jgi:hypothetical protein